jgi:hypothetical protein
VTSLTAKRDKMMVDALLEIVRTVPEEVCHAIITDAPRLIDDATQDVQQSLANS